VVSIRHFLEAIRVAYEGELPLNGDQLRALEHDYRTPLWIIAGPGTGKTHTLVWLVLKRILVDGVQPERILLTTFTRKAAAELESRLILCLQKLIDAGLRAAEAVEVPQLHLGTLHSLCSQILQDQRYEPTLRIRILEDELTQQFFLRRSRNPLLDCGDLAFWQRFAKTGPNDRFAPSRAKRAEGACAYFNRMTENRVDVEAILGCGDPHLVEIGRAYQAYQEALRQRHRTDQAHLQQHFLEFLSTPTGQAWRGKGLTVLVDEYQDTNPIQEQIYFNLAGARRDLTVVGDDDQSLYRFRGATVESLIHFDGACSTHLQCKPTPIYLHENRRSHPDIVAWANRFIGHHPEMNDCGVPVRAPGKPPLTPASGVSGGYPAVMAIAERSAAAAAPKVAAVIQTLMSEGLIQDYSQAALLSFSTRESSHQIGAYTTALREAGIPFHNPRNRTAQKDQRLLAMLGALITILDPAWNQASLPARLPRGVPDYLIQARGAYQALVDAGEYPELCRYVGVSIQAIRQTHCDPSQEHLYLSRKGGRRVTLSGLLYKLLGHEPFATDLADAEGGERLKALNLLLADYESLYYDGELRLQADPAGGARIDPWTLYNIYAVLVEGIQDGLNDPEDDEVSIQRSMVNVMTIHQSKGLEFEVVFVLRPDKQPFVGETHLLEDELAPYVRRPTRLRRRPRELRAAEDAVRLFFVAYSRAKRLLVLAGNSLDREGRLDKWERVLGQTPDGTVLNSKPALEQAGVYLL
jgi:DNA helicase-2/ATP-dependent DNA helicase PcrA